MRKAKLNGLKASFLLSFCVGAAISVAVTLLITALTSIFINNEYIEFNASIYVVTAGQFISAFVGTMFAGKVAENNKLFACCCAGALYYLIFLGVGLLLFDEMNGFALQGFLSSVGGCVSAIFLCFKGKSGSLRKKTRRRSR